MMELMNSGVKRNSQMDRSNKVTISCVKGKEKFGKLCFVIGGRIAARAGLKDGDRVSVYWDRDDLCGIIVKGDDGVKVRQKGSLGTMTFSFSRRDNHPMPAKMTTLQSVTTGGGEIMFEFPKSILPVENDQWTKDWHPLYTEKYQKSL
jgi:hypothetical protein